MILTKNQQFRQVLVALAFQPFNFIVVSSHKSSVNRLESCNKLFDYFVFSFSKFFQVLVSCYRLVRQEVFHVS